jgi:hypothetical protein
MCLSRRMRRDNSPLGYSSLLRRSPEMKEAT